VAESHQAPNLFLLIISTEGPQEHR
jgi:hypothetical protein